MNKAKCVLVCVTRQKNCERLIQEGSRIAAEENRGITVVHVAKRNESFLGNDADADTLEYLYQCSKEVGADMNVLRADDVLKTLVKFAKEARAGRIVIGRSPRSGERDFARELSVLLPTVRFHTIEG